MEISKKILTTLFVVGLAQTSHAATITKVKTFKVSGNFSGNADMSSLAKITENRYLFLSNETVGPQEATFSNGTFKVGALHNLQGVGSGDLDGEALVGLNADYSFVVGSHSRDSSGLEQRSRQVVYQLKHDTPTTVSEVRQFGLESVIEHENMLQPYLNSSPDGNGINIEGASYDDAKSQLVVGFRSPVINHDNRFKKMVPLLRYKTDSEYSFSYMNLEGQGVREMIKIDEGYLIISGNFDSGNTFNFWFWNGGELPSEHNPAAVPVLKKLGAVPDAKSKKHPEGMTIFSKDSTSYSVIVVYDGKNAKNGAPTLVKIKRSDLY